MLVSVKQGDLYLNHEMQIFLFIKANMFEKSFSIISEGSFSNIADNYDGKGDFMPNRQMGSTCMHEAGFASVLMANKKAGAEIRSCFLI